MRKENLTVLYLDENDLEKSALESFKKERKKPSVYSFNCVPAITRADIVIFKPTEKFRSEHPTTKTSYTIKDNG